MKKKKGFTLVELIIVLAIIGVLTAVIVPSWMNYIRKARLQTADGRAKIIFNAAQTVALKYQAAERNSDSVYMGDGDFYYYWNNGTGYQCDSAGNAVADEPPTAQDKRFGGAVSRIFGEEGVYKLHIKDYKVQAVYYTQFANYRYPGSYPVTMLSILRDKDKGMHTIDDTYRSLTPDEVPLDDLDLT